jgi:Alcohol dehydrogenase GroES-like domain
MRALVKAQAAPGLWLQDVPEPEVGINDVLIRVDRIGICGTDLHIHAWDAWARRTIPAGLVIGHEFAGDVVAVGSNVTGFAPGDFVSGEGTPGLRALLPLPRRPPPPVRAHARHRRQHDRRVRRPHRAADDERLAPPRGHRPRRGGGLRPVRQRRAHRARLAGARRGRADHGRRHGDVLAAVRAARHARQHGPRRPRRDAGDPAGALRDRLGRGRLQRPHDQGHLRPRDVRDVVHDGGDGPVRARRLAGHHAPLRALRARGRPSPSPPAAPPARSSCTGTIEEAERCTPP